MLKRKPFLLPLVIAALCGAAPAPRVVNLSFADAQPILQAMDDVLPPELKGKLSDAQAAAWLPWLKARDAAVRARLLQGDEDTMINFLLFGVTFTSQPRVTETDLTALQASQPVPVLQTRIEDLLRGIVAPGTNERLLFLRRLLQQKGFTPTAKEKLRTYLLDNVRRVLREQESYRQIIASARLQGGANAEFVERSQLYRERGLSLDTSLKPNFALDQSLHALQTRGMLTEVRRVAVIGPGLDFTDKAGGYDFYPEQTIQPFLLLDSLLRLKLATEADVRLMTFDISPRINAHLTRARLRASKGVGYNMQLPRDARVKWNPELLKFWETCGAQIGKPIPPAPVPTGLRELQLRAVQVRPTVVAKVTPMDLNVVFQHVELPEAEKFDLIVATNILVYYNAFEQALALKNIERMLKPGGFLLSNNALLELPSSQVRAAGYLTAVYSDQEADGDHIVWYRRK
ncbi:MAG TPA: class I SAM-dependent methyltransferase [Blastocatellia bacterium]|nr:class I SAM-dependent methyltransferase [Blastocatellia bacterium]